MEPLDLTCNTLLAFTMMKASRRKEKVAVASYSKGLQKLRGNPLKIHPRTWNVGVNASTNL